MIRILTLFLIVFALAMGAVWLADHPGTILVRWLGVEIETSVSIALAALAIVFAVILLLIQGIGLLFRGARGLTAYAGRRRAARDRRLLSDGLLALAGGNPAAARRAALQLGAQAPAEDRALLHFLEAQSADQLGVGAEARAAFEAMLDDRATALLGHLGLSDLARADGDGLTAREHARQAFRLDGANRKAFRSHFQFLLEDGAWEEARAAVDHAFKNRAMPEARARSMSAVLFAAEATAKAAQGHEAAALSAARKALALDEACLPGGLVAARIFAAGGRAKRALAIAQTLWPLAPHPALGEIIAQAHGSETPLARLDRIQALVEPNRSHTESRLVVARQALEAGRLDTVREALAPLVGLTSEGPVAATPRAALLMAHWERAETGDATAVEAWLTAAAAAPRDGHWQCQNCGYQGPEWHAVCPACERFDTTNWYVAAPVAALAGPVEAVGLGRPPAPDPAADARSIEARPASDPPASDPPAAVPAPAPKETPRLTPPPPEKAQPSAPEPEIYVPPPPDDPGPDGPRDGRDGAAWS